MSDPQPTVLEYCAAEADPQRTAERLEGALRRKIGYITIIGEDQADTNLFVSVVLEGIIGYEFMPISALDLDIAELPAPTGEARAIAVIYNADHLTAANLELLRLWAEQSPCPIGLVLVGTLKLARTLAQPELQVFAGLIHTRVILARPAFKPAPVSSGRTLRSKLALTAAATLGVGLALAVEVMSPQPVFLTVSDAAVTTVTWLQNQYTKVTGGIFE